MILSATIGGNSRSPLIAGSTLTIRRPVSSASLILDDANGSLSISTLDAVTIQRQTSSGSGGGAMPGSMLPGAILLGAGGGGATFETLFEGFVSAVDIEPAGIPDARRLKLQCLDWNWRLDNPPGFVTKAYSGQTDQDIIIDAITETGLNSDITATTSTIANIVSDITVGFDGATMRDIMEEMSRISGGVWWVKNKTLYYNTEAAATAAAWNINTDSPDNSTTYDVWDMAVASRHDFPLNSVEVIGPKNDDGTRASATASDATSISAIGTYKKKIEVQTVYVDSYAQKVADQLVAAGKDSRQSVSFAFDDDDGRSPLLPNEKITATSTRFDLSAQAFVTREVRIKQRRGNISEFTVDAGDSRPTVTDILRRLEASSRSKTSDAKRVRGLTFIAANGELVESATSVPNLEDMADFTIMLTFKFDSAITAETTLFTKRSGNEGWDLRINASGVLFLRRTKSISDFSLRNDTAIEAGKVYRVVASYSSGGLSASYLYLNGVDVKSGSSSFGSGTNDTDVGHKIIVAAGDGFAAEAVIWDIALPETTVQNVHLVSIDSLPFASDLQLLWKMDEFDDGDLASGSNSIIDRSTNGYDGTPQNTPTGGSVVLIS